MRWTARLVVLAMTTVLGATMLAPTSLAVDVGDEAPPFELPDIMGDPIALADYRGQVVGVVFYLFSPAIFPVFTDNPAIIDTAVSYIRIIVFVFPFVTVGVISTRTFQGLGSGLPSLFLTSLRVIIIAVPLALFFTRVLGYGLTSVWAAFLISGAVSSAVAISWLMLRLRRIESALGVQPAGDLPVGARA